MDKLNELKSEFFQIKENTSKNKHKYLYAVFSNSGKRIGFLDEGVMFHFLGTVNNSFSRVSIFKSIEELKTFLEVESVIYGSDYKKVIDKNVEKDNFIYKYCNVMEKSYLQIINYEMIIRKKSDSDTLKIE